MNGLKPVKSPKITDLIVEQIREMILAGKIKPSEKLPAERELGIQFRASRIAVREALKSLEAAGLVTVRQGLGAFVAETDSRTMSASLYSILRIQNVSITELEEARVVFEPTIARLAAKQITQQDIDLLQENIDKTESLLTSHASATALNLEFHSLVAAATHNKVVELTMRTMLEVATEMTIETSKHFEERLKISQQAVKDHRDILKALRRKDPDEAYKSMLKDVVRVQRGLRHTISGEQSS
ncbi:MAG TPA: FadR/GntR family transcriptional regulator [Syntrophorhabdales bacterium]|nr:FadR/GntR family transcriptional regulator [Syntrophorhabdales bacterium]